MRNHIKLICVLLSLILVAQPLGIISFATEADDPSSFLDPNVGHGAFPDHGSEEDWIEGEGVTGDGFSEEIPWTELLKDNTPEVYGGPMFPHFFQDDYPDVMFGSGSIKTSGCSITSLAMVATYLTGHTYTPDVLADYFGGKASNNMERMEYGIRELQLPCEKNWNWHVTLDALHEGKIAIILVDSRSPFTDSQHFLVLSGVTESGRIWVHDSYRSNYTRWDLISGFQTGFLPEQLVVGFNGAWVFNPEAMPEDPYIYEGESIPYVERRYNDVMLNAQEWELLAKVVWLESQGESFEGQQAVAEVILNRLVSDDFPSSLNDIIYAEGQFRSAAYIDKAQPTQAQYEAIQRAMYGPYILPIDVVYFAQKPTTGNIWGRIGGHVFCYQAGPRNGDGK